MTPFHDNDSHEYEALMSRGRDAERTGQMCWLAAGVAAAVLLSWGMNDRNPGLMLPVVLAVAFGYYAALRSRQQVRLIAGYVEEFHEGRDNGPRWFTRLGRLQTAPGFSPNGDWAALVLANLTNVLAVVCAWLYSANGERGELMAGVVTAVGFAFAYHSVTETSRLRRTDHAALWRQMDAAPKAVTYARAANG